MTQRIRKAPNVTLAATIWFSVNVEIKIPREIRAPPRSNSPRYPEKMGPNAILGEL
jgi:hypothetical protein